MKEITGTGNELVNHNYDIPFSVIMKDMIITLVFSASGCINWKITFFGNCYYDLQPNYAHILWPRNTISEYIF